MRVTILGCGGAGGVPMVSSGWGKCDPANPRNRRRRPSILVEHEDTAILVDTSPDLREQFLDAGVRRLDAVLYTHGHADHLHGIDDLREVNRAMQAPLELWADAEVLDIVGRRFSYVFEPLNGSYYYKPVLTPHRVSGPFRVGAVPVTPFRQEHGYCETLGFRFGPVAYSTDVVELPEESFAALAGVRVWIVGTLTDRPHETHADVDKAVAWMERVGCERGILTHMSPSLDYESLRRRLPSHIEPAYDGMVVEA